MDPKWEKEREKLKKKIENDLETKVGQVSYILKEFPETRSNDSLLIIKWVRMFKGIHSFESLEHLCKTNEMSFESIRRARQKLQHHGYYLPDNKAILKRRMLENVLTEVMADVRTIQ